ncbi:MAG: hypothetical protein J6Q55_00270 [Clostridia bacterium]|nr:hypothetical protein [Clostridia bacterium]
MKQEKKQLIKNFKAIIEDLMDNYENYTDAERAQIKEVFQKVVELNGVLDKYDTAKKSYWVEFLDSYGQFFNDLRY